MFWSLPAAASSFTVLYTFNGGSDGGFPAGDLIFGVGGDLYGTTYRGGANGMGTIFRLSTSGQQRVIYSFKGNPDGAYPVSGLTRDTVGNLYGTTFFGGEFYGTAFKLDTSSAESLLYTFTGGADGYGGRGTLLRDPVGNLFGTTQYGGADYGAIFRIDTAGKQKVVYTFTGGADGAYPVSGLIRDSSGNLYGTARGGGNGCGVLFKLDSTGKFSVIHAFNDLVEGCWPWGGVVRDDAGNFYGTTAYGGPGGGFLSSGAIYKVDSSGNATALHVFTGNPDGLDGSFSYSGLVRDSAGSLYGTTTEGGPSNYGTIFKVDASGNESILYMFTGGSDGYFPESKLALDAAGNLYGVSAGGANGYGVVFKFTP
jgi:uncharacterized repeat protein (TIGR03803 family)